MRSWIHTWSCVWINSATHDISLWWTLWRHLLASTISRLLLLLLLLLFSHCSLSLQYSIDTLYEISCFRYSWTLRWNWLLYVRNGVKMLRLSCLRHLLIVIVSISIVSILLLLQQSDGLWLSLSRCLWLLTYHLETLRNLWHRFILLLLLTIYLLKYWVLYTTETKATVKNCSAVILVSLSESWILVKLSKNFIQRWNWSLSFHLLQFIVSWLSPTHIFTVLIKHWLSSASIHA